MSPTVSRPLRVAAPSWGRLPAMMAMAAAMMCVLAAPALAQPKKKPAPAPAAAPTGDPKPADAKPEPGGGGGGRKGNVKEQTFNFEGLGLNGRSRSPQLLYFLERANEELERASLEKRSFIPHMVRSVEEEAL